MARNEHRKGALPYQFVPIPKLILASLEWQSMPFAARALALDLMAQYAGKNNGRLTPSYEVMRRWGWISTTTLLRAKRVLLESSFCVLTRKGHAPRTAEWIGFTWWHLDYDKSMDIDPHGFPYLNFLNVEAARIDPNEGRKRHNGKMIPVVSKRKRWTPKTAPGTFETKVMKHAFDRMRQAQDHIAEYGAILLGDKEQLLISATNSA